MLTLKEKKTYEFIKNFMLKYRYAPTAAEIAHGIGIKSRGVAHRYLKKLQSANLIQLLPNRHRNIALAEGESLPSTSIPLLGYIAAGSPIEAIPQSESIEFTNILAGPCRYALRVKGDSMIEEGIFDGDVVICEHTAIAKNGQIVVALIDNEQATLKRIRYSPDHAQVTLIPANAKHQPMVYSTQRVKIQGIYIGLIRFAD